LHAGRLERAPGRLLVVDDEAEVAGLVGRPRAPPDEGDELVADVDERHAARAAAQPQVEEAAVELERAVDVVHLERDVVDPDEPWLRAHGRIKCTSPNSCHRWRCVAAAQYERSRSSRPAIASSIFRCDDSG